MFIHCTHFLHLRLGENFLIPRSLLERFLLSFYLYRFILFQQINSDSLYTPKLKLTLARIRETLISDSAIATENGTQFHKVTQPNLSSIVNLKQPEKIHGLIKRVIAVESLIFLGQQYEILRPYLEHLVASPCHGFLHQFYSQTISSATDLRKPVYMAAASQAFDVGGILTLMAKVNWEVRDVMSQHSGYIDNLLRVYICS